MATMDHVYIHYTAALVLIDLYFVNCQLHVENVALSGTCNMTERYERSGDCTEAIDNVTDINLRLAGDGEAPKCIHSTGSNQTGCFPFWQVVLSEEYTITNITIYNRARFPHRLTYTNVTVNGILCKSFGSDVSTIQDVNTFQCLSPIRGRTVTISRHYPRCTPDGDFTLNLCEVQVWVCSKDWYGNDCNTPCSGHCSNNATCDRYDGSCPQGCINGWYGSRCDYSCPQNCIGTCNQNSGTCTECDDSYYGQNCTAKCGHCSQEEKCNKTDGSCSSCKPGWQRPLCTQECVSTHYGQDCRERCGHCSGPYVCNKTNGHCLSCQPGWKPPLCQECNDTYYGPDCREKCGNCYGVESCNKTNGHCSACITGYEPPLCKTAVVCVPLPCNSDGSPVGVVVGSAFTGAAMVTIGELLCFLVYRWKRNSRRNQAKGREQSVSEKILTDLRVQYSSGPRNEETHSDESKQSETTYDMLERNTLYENIKEHSLYTGLSIDNKSKISEANK